MKCLRRSFASLVATIGSSILTGAAFAQRPTNWQIDMQTAGSPVAVRIHDLHNMVLVIVTLITLFVAALLSWVIYRFNTVRHRVPSRVSHNTAIEIAWTVVPILILVIIAIPSFRLIYYQDRAEHPDMTIKVTGHQWYWEYTYPDNGGINFSSYILPDDQLKDPSLRLLAVDNDLVLPVGKTIRILITGSDVIHSFFIPSLGVQRYAIPGRIIETWVRIDRPGDYYGECNQVCGTNHSRMPIAVHAVPEAEFTTWLAQAKTKFAADAPPSAIPSAMPTRLAQNRN